MSTIKEDDKLTLAKYAQDNDLVNLPGWKWARRLTKNPKKFIQMAKIFAAQTKRHGVKYKHGVKVPRNYKEAIKFDQENGNTLWQDAVDREMGQIMDFKTFKPLLKGSKPPSGHTFVPVHLCFDVKFDLRCKVCLVAGGNWQIHQIQTSILA